jgi:L-asparaginase
MQSTQGRVVLLGTGGTIAGTAADASDNVGYRAGQLSVAQLLAAVPPLCDVPLEAEQVAQVDSKDMDLAVWLRLLGRLGHHLGRDEVTGVVVTHGTDTLEETAYFLQRVLAPVKPVVLTAAMRPATALLADGPQNLLDAVTVSRHDGARGVVVVFGGTVYGPFDLRKRHSYRLDAFGAGDAGPLALVEEGALRALRDWPTGSPVDTARLPRDPAQWPRVAVLHSHAGLDDGLVAAQVNALMDHGVQGIVVAGTGNGTVHRALLSALRPAQDAGVVVWRSSRCADGGVVGAGGSGEGDAIPSAGPLTAWQARVELMLRLLRA